MANFKEKMCSSAAQLLVSSLGSLQSINFDNEELSDEMIDSILKLNLSDQKSLVERARYFITIGIDHTALKRQLQELEQMRDEHELEDIYLLNGAPLTLMRRLFGLHASEFSRRRNTLHIRGNGSGRPRLCDERTEHLIWRIWEKVGHLSEKERFIKVIEETNLDLHIIWSALRDHIDD